MGIKIASVRHTDVVVMAPALTETAQTKSLNFVASPSRTPSLSLKNQLKKSPQILREALQPKLPDDNNLNTGMNGHSPVDTVTYNINGLVKNLTNKFLPVNHKDKEEAENQKKTDNSLNQLGGYMMNSGYMGDPAMGLQKSSKEICEGEKVSPEDEQIFKNFPAMNNEEINSTAGLSQNVEDIIKAISNLEGTPNEIESGPSGDIENIFDNGLFNEADIINMCVDDTLVAVNKDTLIKDRIEDIRKRQFQVGRKCEFLMRRLKKIQARVVGKHAAEEITGVIEYSSNLLEYCRYHNTQAGEVLEPDIKCDVKPVSVASLTHFMRQMEHAVNQQTNTVAKNNAFRGCKYFGSGSTTNSLVTTTNGLRSSLPGSVLPQYPAKVQREIESTAGELKSQLVKIQHDIDSDVTESSSGCESCDEFVNYNNSLQHTLSISKRASWRWAEERALIASKWTWLQSQIADLEYRIRQHNDIKKNIRAAKGALKFAKEPGPAPNLPNGCNNTNTEKGGDVSCSRTRGLVRNSFAKRKLLQVAGIHKTSKKAARATSIRCTCSSTLPGCALCTGRPEPGQPSEPISTLPVNQRVAYLDPGFHPALSFPSDVASSIHYNAVMKCPEWQSRASRISTKTSSLTSPEEKNRLQRAPSVDHQVVDLQRSKAAALAVSVSKSLKLRRKMARGKRRRRAGFLTLDRYRYRRKHSTGMSGGDSEETVDQDVEFSGGSRYPSPVPSPASTTHSHTTTPASKDKEGSMKRKRENSYDIDNIVIPYSMASATRLEKLTYKEILTPKWRHISKESSDDLEHKNGIIRRSSHEQMDVSPQPILEAEEDTSDEAHLARHERCQIEEKKKFLSYLKLPGGLRGRAQRRTDSRADSSGPNTPDGMSPRADDGAGTADELPTITSPPLNPPGADGEAGGRRRTISNSQATIPEVPPYEPRKFPLSDEVYKAMLDMNDDHQYPPMINSSYQESIDIPPSPGSVSTDSADSFLGEEDPNDPEWIASTSEKTNCKR